MECPATPPGPGCTLVWGMRRGAHPLLAEGPPRRTPCRERVCVRSRGQGCRMPPHQPTEIAKPACAVEGVPNAGPRLGTSVVSHGSLMRCSGGKG